MSYNLDNPKILGNKTNSKTSVLMVGTVVRVNTFFWTLHFGECRFSTASTRCPLFFFQLAIRVGLEFSILISGVFGFWHRVVGPSYRPAAGRVFSVVGWVAGLIFVLSKKSIVELCTLHQRSVRFKVPFPGLGIVNTVDVD
jgi:hypothetical protein